MSSSKNSNQHDVEHSFIKTSDFFIIKIKHSFGSSYISGNIGRILRTYFRHRGSSPVQDLRIKFVSKVNCSIPNMKDFRGGTVRVQIQRIPTWRLACRTIESKSIVPACVRVCAQLLEKLDRGGPTPPTSDHHNLTPFLASLKLSCCYAGLQRLPPDSPSSSPS